MWRPTGLADDSNAPDEGAASVRARAEQLTQQAQEARRRHRSVDAVFDMVDRDAEVGGGIIAGALAYRFFIWLLPLALLAVAGLGIASDASSTSPEDAADEVGLADLVTGSVAQAANSSARWYALGSDCSRRSWRHEAFCAP